MVRVERGTQAIVDEGIEFKKAEIDRCRELELETQEERAECVKTASTVVDTVEAITATIRLELIAFWSVYPLLEAKLANKERLSFDDIEKLIEIGGRVMDAYQELVEVLSTISESERPQAALDVVSEAELAITITLVHPWS